jgi:hypothetical protein
MGETFKILELLIEEIDFPVEAKYPKLVAPIVDNSKSFITRISC